MHGKSTNPYFLYFDLSLPYNSDIKTFKNGLILLQYMKNEEYRKQKQKSKLGQLTHNTSYSLYAIDNKFVGDNNNFIEKKQGSSKFSFAFIYQNETFGVWIDKKLDKIYVSEDYIKNTPFMFSTTLNNHSDNTILLKSAKKYKCWKIFIENFEYGNIRFENMKIKNICQELIKSLLST